MKTLYFEGAGWAGADISKATVGNCRIRTAFHNDAGKAFYVEMSACEVTKHSADRIKHLKYAGFVTDCFYITGSPDDCNQHSIHSRNDVSFEYNKENILKFVNRLGCSFGAIEVLPDLAGYRVFKEKFAYGTEQYNYGDEFQHNAELTKRAEEINRYFYDMEKKERQADRTAGTRKFVHSPSGACYPNFSLWVDENDPALLHLLRHYNGYNRHWTIKNAEDWQDTITEKKLGKYAC